MELQNLERATILIMIHWLSLQNRQATPRPKHPPREVPFNGFHVEPGGISGGHQTNPLLAWIDNRCGTDNIEAYATRQEGCRIHDKRVNGRIQGACGHARGIGILAPGSDTDDLMACAECGNDFSTDDSGGTNYDNSHLPAPYACPNGPNRLGLAGFAPLTQHQTRLLCQRVFFQTWPLRMMTFMLFS